MLDVVALVVASVAVLWVAALARQVARLERVPAPTPSPPPELPAVRELPLQGSRIALQIEQDHPHAPFARLLAEQFEGEDVAWVGPGPAGDFVLKGTVSCNGYADVYFAADITCFRGGEPLCTIVERPPHGDRPVNLAIEVVARLRRELLRTRDLSERRQAIRELTDGGLDNSRS